MAHNERCKECKKRIQEILEKIYGPVITNYRIELLTKPDSLRKHPRYQILNEIFLALINHRGYSDFVKASYVDVDFFLPEQDLIVEFDESQHFTEPRKIALSYYPHDLKLGFAREVWMKHCDEIKASDNDPPFRDEQRAWYDTLRDFLPEEKGFRPTVRLYAKDMVWCDLNPENFEDIEHFRHYLRENSKNNADDPILDTFINFEYLLNSFKLQYLLDCVTKEFNKESGYLLRNAKNPKILNSGGDAFKAYLNIRFQRKGYLGPLIKGIAPWQYYVVKQLDQINDDLKTLVVSSDNWFRFFCEYTLIKTTLHEIIADIHDPENIAKYGYPDLMLICNLERKPIIEGKELRSFVESCLNLGINPSEEHSGSYQTVNHLSSCKYAEFQARRDEWIDFAWHCINQIKPKISAKGLKKVMQWKRHSPCAFDTGPVFIRKKREFLLPTLTDLFNQYKEWDQEKLRDNLHEIVEKKEILLIDSYWEYFNGNQTLEYFEHNHTLALQFEKIQQSLDSYYREIESHQKVIQLPLIVKQISTQKPGKKDSKFSSILYDYLRKELDPLFSKSIFEQKTKFTYRGRNTLGYPRRTELDMISLFKHSSSNAQAVRFRIYPYVLAGHLNHKNPKEIITFLPAGSLMKQERENPHPAEVFIAGVFSNENDIERFLNFIRSAEK